MYTQPLLVNTLYLAPRAHKNGRLEEERVTTYKSKQGGISHQY